MADYATLKVPELKKLLQERALPVTGNKADLIARLHEHDGLIARRNEPEKATDEPKPAAAPVSAEEDPIDYSDDDVPAAKSEAKLESQSEAATEPAPTEQKVAETAVPAAEPTAKAQAPAAEDSPAVAATANGVKPVDGAVADSAPKTDFSANLPATSADEEARKRAERAKRFGIVEGADEEAKKKAERTKRFGVDENSLVSGLDSALSEKRDRKRGREGASNAGADGERGAKRQQNGRGRRPNGRDNRSRGGRNGDTDRGPSRKEGSNGSKPRGVLSDPSERAKAEARAKRFSKA